MAERRKLVDGLKSKTKYDPEELGFVYGKDKAKKRKPPKPAAPAKATVEKPKTEPVVPPPLRPQTTVQPAPIVRVPFATRISSTLASEIKRVTLERQIDGLHPNSLQDIVESALELWLRSQGRPRP